MSIENKLVKCIAEAFDSADAGSADYLLDNGIIKITARVGPMKYTLHMLFSIQLTWFHHITGYVKNDQVAEVMADLNLKNSNGDSSIVKYKGGSDWNQLMENLSAYPLKKEADIPPFTEALVHHYQEHIIPFFQEYPTLESINEKILNGVPKAEYKDYIPNPKNLKVLIMMKLCGNDKYDSFKEWALSSYQRGVERDPKRYGADFETLKKLVHHLDTAPELNR